MSQQQTTSWIIDLRTRLAKPPGQRLPPTDARRAAVLVPLYVDAGELWTLLTKRSDALPTHRGQIAFPGGALEEEEDAWTAALRETHEEVGIEPQKILRLGALDEAETPSGFHILPFVGAVPFPVETSPNPDEIEEIFSVPISAFLNPSMVEDRAVAIDGQQRLMRVYHLGGRQVWGLTARIVQNLLLRLGLEMPTGEQ